MMAIRMRFELELARPLTPVARPKARFGDIVAERSFYALVEAYLDLDEPFLPNT